MRRLSSSSRTSTARPLRRSAVSRAAFEEATPVSEGGAVDAGGSLDATGRYIVNPEPPAGSVFPSLFLPCSPMIELNIPRPQPVSPPGPFVCNQESHIPLTSHRAPP